MKATKRQIYHEQASSEEHIQYRGYTPPLWQLSMVVDAWYCPSDGVRAYVLHTWTEVRQQDTQEVEEQRSQQLLTVETEAEAQRAAIKLFDQRVQALAGVVTAFVDVKVEP